MDYDTIRMRIREDIAVITLNRGDVMNALNAQMRAEITHAVKTASRTARVIVMTGAGRAFCSGQDLGTGGNAANLDLERTLRDEYVPMIEAIVNAPVPTIAAVNGA
ncbi:MAG: enoyl-CoA hydratase-related protein, partial [Pseudomonadota bacterium]